MEIGNLITFYNIQSYLKHLDDLVESYKMRASDYERFKKKLRISDDFRRALHKDLTLAFEEDFKFGNSENQNYIYATIGKLGRGKSTLAYLIGKKSELIHLDILIAQCYEIDEIFQALKEMMNIPHSVVILDEPLKLTGLGANTVKKNLENILQMCREYSINFIFNIKRFTYIENVDIYLELFGIDFENEITRCLWRDDDSSYLGLVYFTKNFTEEEFEDKKTQKGNKWNDLVENEGKHKAYSNIGEMTNKIFDRIKGEKDLIIKKISDIKAYINEHYAYPQQMVKDLASKIKGKIDFSKIKKRKSKGNKLIDLKITDFLLIEEEELNMNDICDIVENMDFSQNPFEKDLMYSLVQGISYRDIMRDLQNESFKYPWQITHFKRRIQKYKMGDSGENTFLKILKRKGYKKIDHFGLNSDRPDYIIHDIKWVISLKTIFDKIKIPALTHEISINEYNYAKIHNYKLMYVAMCLLPINKGVDTRKIYYYEYISGFDK